MVQFSWIALNHRVDQYVRVNYGKRFQSRFAYSCQVVSSMSSWSFSGGMYFLSLAGLRIVCHAGSSSSFSDVKSKTLTLKLWSSSGSMSTMSPALTCVFSLVFLSMTILCLSSTLDVDMSFPRKYPTENLINFRPQTH